MNDRELATVCSYIASNWPAAAMNRGTLEVYRLELGPLDFDQTVEVLRSRFADGEFPPTPMRIRNAVIRGREEDLDVGALIDELLDGIARVGYAYPEPEWSTPILAEWVHRRGGWSELCKATPARAAADPRGVGDFNTWRAQARDDLRTLAASVGMAQVREAIGAGAALELDAPGSRFEQ